MTQRLFLTMLAEVVLGAPRRDESVGPLHIESEIGRPTPRDAHHQELPHHDLKERLRETRDLCARGTRVVRFTHVAFPYEKQGPGVHAQ